MLLAAPGAVFKWKEVKRSMSTVLAERRTVVLPRGGLGELPLTSIKEPEEIALIEEKCIEILRKPELTSNNDFIDFIGLLVSIYNEPGTPNERVVGISLHDQKRGQVITLEYGGGFQAGESFAQVVISPEPRTVEGPSIWGEKLIVSQLGGRDREVDYYASTGENYRFKLDSPDSYKFREVLRKIWEVYSEESQ
jgi:hypothetical protein